MRYREFANMYKLHGFWHQVYSYTITKLGYKVPFLTRPIPEPKPMMNSGLKFDAVVYGWDYLDWVDFNSPTLMEVVDEIKQNMRMLQADQRTNYICDILKDFHPLWEMVLYPMYNDKNWVEKYEDVIAIIEGGYCPSSYNAPEDDEPQIYECESECLFLSITFGAYMDFFSHIRILCYENSIDFEKLQDDNGLWVSFVSDLRCKEVPIAGSRQRYENLKQQTKGEYDSMADYFRDGKRFKEFGRILLQLQNKKYLEGGRWLADKVELQALIKRMCDYDYFRDAYVHKPSKLRDFIQKMFGILLRQELEYGKLNNCVDSLYLNDIDIKPFNELN